MERKGQLTGVLLFFIFCLLTPHSSSAVITQHVNARSAMLLDMENGTVLFEQNADSLIAPASITKILTLYLIFDAIKQGQVSLSDKVEVSRRAASMPPSRMGLRAGTFVSMEELIRGIAVVSGNDACVAAAEHLSGSVERFVNKMNAKARELGMTNSHFMTPNGLPADGQLTTARDIAKLSAAYLHRFPESLAIHSMQSYTYGKHTHHNANRLLGKCPGVDGLKTGFVCASGYNISATAKRNHTRIIAVVMGARSPWIRCAEAEKLIEAGFREAGAPCNEIKCVEFKPSATRKRASAIEHGDTGRRHRAAAHSRIKLSSVKNTVRKKKQKIKDETGGVKTAGNSTVRSRRATRKDAISEAGGVKKPSDAKSCAASVKTSPKSSGAKSAAAKKHHKTAAVKKNVKGVPHAHEVKKHAKG